MLTDITFGKYYNTQSIIHSLDARTGFIRLIVYFISVLTVRNTQGFVIVSLFLLLTVLLSRIPVSYFFKGVWRISFYIILCCLMNVLTDFSLNGLVNALLLSFKIILCVVSASLYTLTTTISHISDSLEWFMTPLKLIGVPVRDLALMLSISLRFIPVLAEESKHIIRAQKARGAEFNNGSIIRRAKNILPLIIPVFASTVKRASELSDALNCRAYAIRKARTRLYPLKFTKKDFFALLLIILYQILIIRSKSYGN